MPKQRWKSHRLPAFAEQQRTNRADRSAGA
jgi:hypothetical protein